MSGTPVSIFDTNGGIIVCTIVASIGGRVGICVTAIGLGVAAITGNIVGARRTLSSRVTRR